jgi:hypothetical protein
VAAFAKCGELERGGAAPLGKEPGGGLVEGGEFGMAKDGGLDLGQRQRKVGIAGAASACKQAARTPGSTCQ